MLLLVAQLLNGFVAVGVVYRGVGGFVDCIKLVGQQCCLGLELVGTNIFHNRLQQLVHSRALCCLVVEINLQYVEFSFVL